MIERCEHKTNFTVIDNLIFRDERLSLKARGLLGLMLTMSDEWEFNVRGLATLCGVSKDAISPLLKELETAGYLEREKVRRESGTFCGYSYSVHEIPVRQKTGAGKNRVRKTPVPGNPDERNSNSERNINGKKRDKPQRKAYGEYANVYLTDEEMEKFRAEYPNDWQRFIDELSAYQDSTGEKYSGYLSTLRNWARRDRRGSQSRAEVETGPTPLEWLDYTGEGG